MRLNRSLGFTLLAIYLILVGLAELFSLGFAGMGVVLGILALAAGLLILLGR